jgi:hypothetical protein
MAIDWDAELLGPLMAVFGEGTENAPSSWPTYTPAGGSAFQLADAVFDQAYQRVVELAEGVQGTAQSPVLGVRAILFAVPPKQGDSVYIPSVDTTFAVADIQPDGHGHILLILMKTEA